MWWVTILFFYSSLSRKTESHAMEAAAVSYCPNSSSKVPAGIMVSSYPPSGLTLASIMFVTLEEKKLTLNMMNVIFFTYLFICLHQPPHAAV